MEKSTSKNTIFTISAIPAFLLSLVIIGMLCLVGNEYKNIESNKNNLVQAKNSSYSMVSSSVALDANIKNLNKNLLVDGKFFKYSAKNTEINKYLESYYSINYEINFYSLLSDNKANLISDKDFALFQLVNTLTNKSYGLKMSGLRKNIISDSADKDSIIAFNSVAQQYSEISFNNKNIVIDNHLSSLKNQTLYLLFSGGILLFLLFFVILSILSVKSSLNNVVSTNGSSSSSDDLPIINEDFLTKMSHDIRTPLNGILGFLEFLKESNLSNDQKDCVTAIENSSNKLVETIDSILEKFKVENPHSKKQSDETPETVAKDVETVVEDVETVVEETTSIVTDSIIKEEVEEEVSSLVPNVIADVRADLNIDNFRLLVAEDNIVNKKLIETVFSKNGFKNITIVSDGQEAFETRKENTYDLILMDINMPNMTGDEATGAIIAWENENNIPHIPIVALTANAIKGDKERFIKAGMSNYLTKPIDIEAMKQVFKEELDFEF